MLLQTALFALGVLLAAAHSVAAQDGLTPVQRCQVTSSKIDCLKVYVSVIDPKTVGDVFGKRIGDRFVAIQVTITNRSEKFQFLIHDVSLDLSKIIIDKSLQPPANLKLQAAQQARDQAEADERRARADAANCRRDDEACLAKALDAKERLDDAERDLQGLKEDLTELEMSSLELSLMRGVAEKGQGNDPRNKIYRILRGVGTIAAGLIGVTTFGSSYAPTVAMFNGPFLSAYTEAFPDYTVNQMNRLSDSAYKTNTLVPRQQAKVMVAFISQPLFMGKELRNKFAKDPSSIWQLIDFRQADAVVDGSFIEQIENLPPLVTDVQFEAAELAKFQDAEPEIKGKIIGRGLSKADVKLLGPVPAGLSLALDGTPADNELHFIIHSTRPVPPDTTLNYVVSSTQGSQTISRVLGYVAKPPTLTKIDPPEVGSDSDEISVQVEGTNFLPDINVNSFRFVGPGGISVADVAFESATKLVLTVRIREGASGKRSLLLIGSNGTSNSIPFVVKEPEEKTAKPAQ
jgi:hypothetical protein